MLYLPLDILSQPPECDPPSHYAYRAARRAGRRHRLRAALRSLKPLLRWVRAPKNRIA